MRYSGSEKLEIIKLVEQSTLSVCRTLASIGIPRSTFYDWYSRYQDGGIEALEDGRPRPRRVWNKIPDEIGTAIVNLALEEPDLSPRELAVNFTDTKGSFAKRGLHVRARQEHPSHQSGAGYRPDHSSQCSVIATPHLQVSSVWDQQRLGALRTRAERPVAG